MDLRKSLAVALLGFGVAAIGVSLAQHPPDQAYQKIVAAQEANECDMQGHAAKAKDLLDQANRELKAAAASANKNRK